MLAELLKNLQNMKTESWLLVIVAIVLSIIVLTWISKLIIKLAKGGLKSITIGKVSASFGGSNGNGEKKSPHANCPHSKDIVIFLQKQRDNQRKADKTEFIYIPRDMMNFAEDFIDTVIAKMLTIYYKILKEKHGSKIDLVASPEVHKYEMAVCRAKIDILKEVRRMVRDNGFIEKHNAGKFDEYKKTKIQNLISIMTDSLNRYYVCDNPSREEVYDRNRAVLLAPGCDYNLYQKLSDALDELLSISIRHNNAIKKLDNEVDDEIPRLFGS